MKQQSNSLDCERGLEDPRGHIARGRRDAAFLGLLLEADGRVVSKSGIADRVWPGCTVSDESIAQSLCSDTCGTGGVALGQDRPDDLRQLCSRKEPRPRNRGL